MKPNKIIKLHWKLYFPLVGLLWIIIGLSITYTFTYEKRTRVEVLENKLRNINASIINAYENGDSIQPLVNSFQIYTDPATTAPIRITVYDKDGKLIADNPETTILLHDKDGKPIPELIGLIDNHNYTQIRNMSIDSTKCMVNAAKSRDNNIQSFAALPYSIDVLSFINIDPMVWITILTLGIIISIITFIGLKNTCRDIYSLQKFAKAISQNKVTDVDSFIFSKDELGDVSQNLVSIYHDKIKAEQDKVEHERFVSRKIQHELRTPIGIIKGYIDTVLDDPEMPNETKKQFLTRAKKNADRLVGLIRTVNDFTHLENGAKSLPSKPFLLSNTLKALIKDIEAGDILREMTFKHNIPQDCAVNANETLIINVLLNLINNAVKYSEGTEISFKWIKTKNGKHHFTFSDNGKGIGKEHISKIFNPFYRITSAGANKESGMGLGLAIVQRTITALDCTISAKNSSSGGLEYSFTLPDAQTPLEQK